MIVEAQDKIKNRCIMDMSFPQISNETVRLIMLLMWFWFRCISFLYFMQVSQEYIGVAALHGN